MTKTKRWLNSILHFFGFSQKEEKQNKTIDLTPWYRFLSLDNDTWIGTLISINHINDVAASLIYTDEKIRNRFIKKSKDLTWKPQTAKLEKFIEKNKTISKLKSDEAKLIVVECLKSKQHLLAATYPY